MQAVRSVPDHSWMFGVELICSDEACAWVQDTCADTLAALDHAACEGCGSSMQIIAVWEIPAEDWLAPAAQPIELRRAQRDAHEPLRHAA